MPFFRTAWFRVFHTHFVLCTFLGVFVLDSSAKGLHRLLSDDPARSVVDYLAGSLVTGLIVAIATWLLHRFWFRRLRRKFLPGATDRGIEWRGAVAGFVCGALSPLYLLSSFTLLGLAVVFLGLSVGFARSFLRRVAVILHPGNHPRAEDIARLAFLYGTLAACFTILNSAVALLLRGPLGATGAFRGFGDVAHPLVDSFYLTVVIITTLGFGDITPATPGVKLLVSFQVIVAWLLFALLIGTITRGALPRGEEQDGDRSDDPDSR